VVSLNTSQDHLNEKTEPSAAVVAAAKELHEAVDRAVDAYGAPESLGIRCDEFTPAVKQFAALILAERIRRSFLEQVDPARNVPLESPEEKLAHAKAIRVWLAPFNLAFSCRTADGRQAPHQLFAGSTGKTQGTFLLSEYGHSSPRRAMSSWENSIRAVVKNPVLVDVTDLTRHHDSRNR
jgi:hypothetical protein